ncbi:MULTISPECIES: sn-glycerol-3-phosphate ABC transporter ATP-binding protein UgpC [unclassified Rhizobium]|uniref:ABC transporter ATP-binding protein n=1 Tax=unclassified Rhizobium TaxID=2613769 RepID=UPI0006F20E7B|nr:MULTISPECIES: sn-glycerol-3-phosphate ABC transporter ATP-binding protein UgpC [unclassified Rhizobium]KQV37502.1 sugar ABC transporter ATP-binding protein [Rhizobium sp. Root1212]KRD30292.1 sugar ABC transporter ATP-binding protein [Rhizobium sp. Root268]
MTDVRLTDIRKSFGAVEIIKGVDLKIDTGEFVVFVGPSGCGKSTLLRMIAGLEDITSGELTIGGKVMNDVDPSKRGIAMVFQSYALYPHMTVRENMGFALRFAGAAKEEVDARVNEAARILELGPLMDRKPKALSGGQRQRVAIGRAIVRDPDVFLFDEPLSNLDAELRVHMRVEIAKLHKTLKSTIVYVTHDQVEAMTLADKIVVLRAGIVEQVGAPLDLYDDPDNMFVAGFIGSPRMNFLKARIVSTGNGSAQIALTNQPDVRLDLPITSTSVKAGDDVSLGIRPEHFRAAGEGDTDMIVDIDVAEHLGNTSYVYAHVSPEERIIIEREDSRSVGNREKLAVGLSAARAYLFDKDGMRMR